MWAALGHLWWLALDARDGRQWLHLGPAQPSALAPLLVTVGTMAISVSMAMHYVFRAYENAAGVERRVPSEIAAREAELRALRAQMDPRFLFNSLNSISGLVAVDPSGARSMARRLGRLVRQPHAWRCGARISGTDAKWRCVQQSLESNRCGLARGCR